MGILDALTTGAMGMRAAERRLEIASAEVASFGLPIAPPASPSASVPSSATPAALPSGVVVPNDPYVRVYDPSSAEADGSGFVTYPNVDLAGSMTSMLLARREHQANAATVRTADAMLQDAIDLLRRR